MTVSAAPSAEDSAPAAAPEPGPTPRPLWRRALPWAVLLGAGWLIVGWFGQAAVTAPLPRRPVDHTPAPLPFQRVEFTADGGPEGALTLVGWHVPGARPETVVLCHGRGDSRMGMLYLIRVLHQLGYTSFAFDFRAHGESGGTRSTIGAAEQNDLTAALDWLDAHAPAPVGVFGYSMGGTVALSVAARDPRIRGVVTEGAIDSVPGVIREWYGPLIVPEIWAADPWIRLRTGRWLTDAEPVRTIARVAPRPVLIIHSRADEVVPFAAGRRLYAAAHEPKEFWALDDAPHVGGILTDRTQYVRRLADFLRRAFGADA